MWNKAVVLSVETLKLARVYRCLDVMLGVLLSCPGLAAICDRIKIPPVSIYL